MTLDAVARFGSIARAAKEMHKVHSGVLYTMKSLEDHCGLEIFDRTGYRTSLTPMGTRIWQDAQKVLRAEEGLRQSIASLRSGWEPAVKVVFDGVLPSAAVLDAFGFIQKNRSPTRLSFSSEYLASVLERFRQDRCDLMLSVIAPTEPGFITEMVGTVELVLVAAKTHPLGTSGRKLDARDLEEHTLINVRGSDSRLGLGTSQLGEQSQVHLPDFHSKRQAILTGLGFGWLPRYLIREELKSRSLRPLLWTAGNTSELRTYLTVRDTASRGKTLELLRGYYRKCLRKI